MRIGGQFKVLGALLRELMILGVAQETGATIRLNSSNQLIKIIRHVRGGIREEFLKSTNWIGLTAKVLGGLRHVVLTALLASLKANGGEKVSHFEVVGERLMVGAQTEFHSKPAVQPSTTGLTVSVIEENLDEITLIDKLTTKEEHVAVVIHILEVGLEGVSAALAWWSRIGSIMIEKWVPSKSQYSTEVAIAQLIKVESRAEEVSHVAILDQVGASEEE
jgi:hypothetical protein